MKKNRRGVIPEEYMAAVKEALAHPDDDITLYEIGQLLGGLSKMRICQIEKKAMAKLRKYFSSAEAAAYLEK